MKTASKTELLYCKSKDARAIGEFTDEGFLVLENSICNLRESKTAGSWLINLRKRLLNSGVLAQENDTLVFKSDYLFGSPSAAAGAVLGRRSNGWIDWKYKNGKTLDEVKRQNNEKNEAKK